MRGTPRYLYLHVGYSDEVANATGIEVSLLAQSAAIKSIRIPSAEGPIEIVLGHEDPERYIVDPNYLGTTLGRYTGRIANAQFRIGDSIVQLDKNDPEHGHLLYGDPCHSLEERCGNHDGFVQAVRRAAEDSAPRRYLPSHDAEVIVATAEDSDVLR